MHNTNCHRSGPAPGPAIHYALAESDLGWALIAATDRGICRIDLDADPEALTARLADAFPQAQVVDDDAALRETVRRVLALLERPAHGLDLPLDIQGTAFQRRVWAALQEIPVGEIRTYGGVASSIGQPNAARAVARACAANPLAVAIPCHRVVRADGALGGYRWGLDRKAQLLARESEG
jgi:AraC family transcriptional regulator, regulatory protein of adaptative response / methylated-DNA-[protein]-cysteine methyltransferase